MQMQMGKGKREQEEPQIAQRHRDELKSCIETHLVSFLMDCSRFLMKCVKSKVCAPVGRVTNCFLPKDNLCIVFKSPCPPYECAARRKGSHGPFALANGRGY